MKKLLVVLMVLSVATMANAGLTITGAPTDGKAKLTDVLTIGVSSDGTEVADAPGFLVITGPGAANIDAATNAINAGAVMFWSGDPADGAVFMDFAIPANPIPNMPSGQIADGIAISFSAVGDVTLALYLDRTPVGGTFQLMDSKTITVPEPLTLGLLGIGGLFLRRRK